VAPGLAKCRGNVLRSGRPLADHARPLARRRWNSRHQFGEVHRFLHEGLRSRRDRPRRGRREHVRPVQGSAFRPAAGAQLVRGEQSLLGSLRRGGVVGPLRGPCQERAGDDGAAQEARHPPGDEEALGQSTGGRETERGSEIPETHGGGCLAWPERPPHCLHPGPGRDFLLPLRPSGGRVGGPVPDHY